MPWIVSEYCANDGRDCCPGVHAIHSRVGHEALVSRDAVTRMSVQLLDIDANCNVYV